jgi:hypothetical protein
MEDEREKRSPDVLACLAQAIQCEYQAELALDLNAKETFLRIAQHWRFLAEKYEFIQRTDRFLGAPKDEAA